ncbi:MAG: antitoxin of type II TA system, VapB [Chloroflexi bacterium]|jgi:Arc/MetJ family transcription regulator|nr:MAG: antitoxin of type II TA system, VapB [Chloroflexota bacterium]
MRTTLDVDEKLLEEAMKLTGEKSRSKALNKVMAEYVRRQRIDDLLTLAGTIDMDDSWYEMRHMEPR